MGTTCFHVCYWKFRHKREFEQQRGKTAATTLIKV